MKISREHLVRESESTGFRGEILEKVIHLVNLLDLINSNSELKGKFALKGGTALNLFIFDVPRLSVDVDLNYIGHLSREKMLEEKPDIEQTIQSIILRDGYLVKRKSDEHAGGKWYLTYFTSEGDQSNLQLDINYLLRTPIWPVVETECRYPRANKHVWFPILDIHELAAGKLAALFSRTSSRDIFDTYKLLTSTNISRDKLKFALIIYGAMNRKDWTEISVGSIIMPNVKDFVNDLIPMLSREQIDQIQDHSEWTNEIFRVTLRELEPLVQYSDNEKEFLESIIKSGEIRPSLLTSDPEMINLIEQHPGLQWKALNVRKHFNL